MIKRSKAFALPVVLVISVLISLLVLFALSLAEIEQKEYRVYHTRKQRVLDLHSAVALYCADSLLFPDHQDTLQISLFGFRESDVKLSKKAWGLYEIVSVSSDKIPLEYSAMCGKVIENDLGANLWLSDKKRPLSMAGTTRIGGYAYIPPSGINYTQFNGYSFSGGYVNPSKVRVSAEILPAIDSTMIERLDSYRKLSSHAWYYRNSAGDNVSFSTPSVLVYGKNADRTFNLKGNQILYGDRLTIGHDSNLDGILVFARTVLIKKGFRGRCQVICTDSLLIDRDVHLSMPSGLFVYGAQHPYISVGEQASIDGYVVILNKGLEDKELSHPCFIQNSNSVIQGLVYIDGVSRIEGTIYGSAYLSDCYAQVDGNIFPGVLRDAVFRRDDEVVYPILMTGSYRRREIYKVY